MHISFKQEEVDEK